MNDFNDIHRIMELFGAELSHCFTNPNINKLPAQVERIHLKSDALILSGLDAGNKKASKPEWNRNDISDSWQFVIPRHRMRAQHNLKQILYSQNSYGPKIEIPLRLLSVSENTIGRHLTSALKEVKLLEFDPFISEIAYGLGAEHCVKTDDGGIFHKTLLPILRAGGVPCGLHGDTLLEGTIYAFFLGPSRC